MDETDAELVERLERLHETGVLHTASAGDLVSVLRLAREAVKYRNRKVTTEELCKAARASLVAEHKAMRRALDELCSTCPECGAYCRSDAVSCHCGAVFGD